MIIILYETYPYDGQYTGCIEVPDDFVLEDAITEFRQTDECQQTKYKESPFMWWLERKYPKPMSNVLEMGVGDEGLIITKPNETTPVKPIKI